MTSLEMVRYERTGDMERLYQMLDNERGVYNLYQDAVERLAKSVIAGKNMDYEELAKEYSEKISVQLQTLCIRHHKTHGEWLMVTIQECEIIAWQWFYNQIMEAVLFTEHEQKTLEPCIV